MLLGSGIALEEAVDDDPIEQELSVIMASVRDLIGS